MRKGLTTSQKRLILMLGGFLILVGTFFFIYQRNMDTVTELEADTRQKEMQVDFLATLQIRSDEMRKAAPQQKKEIETYTKEFPCKITQQMVISEIYKMSVKSGVHLQEIKPGSEQIFFQDGKFLAVGQEENTATTGEEERKLSEVEKNPEKKVEINQMVGKVTNYEVSLTGSREQILKAFDWIADNKQHMSLSNISLSFDKSTGKLVGTVMVNFYCLNGNGRVYEEPDISSIILGNEDVFGTFKK